jgi:hypothetical protein
VNAREQLIRSVYSKLSQNQMEKLVDAYASSLARAIRLENPDRSDDWSDGAEWAADLIDPDVEM